MVIACSLLFVIVLLLTERLVVCWEVAQGSTDGVLVIIVIMALRHGALVVL